MLDSGSRQEEIGRWIFSLPCQVQFPPKLREELERTGAVPGAQRRCAAAPPHLLPRREAPRGPGTPGVAAGACPAHGLALRLYERFLQERLRIHPQRGPLSRRTPADGPADRRSAAS